jgi:DNA-binding MarR family transcriptional regulator
MERDHVDGLVEQWAAERPELDTSGLRLSARIVRLQRFLDQASQAVVSGFGLQLGELNVLAALRRAGDPYELTPTDLYRGLLVSSGAMTNRLDRLEEHDLVTRVPDPEDRRRIKVALTARGAELIDQAMDEHTAVLREAFSGIDARQREDLEGLLRSVLVQARGEATRSRAAVTSHQRYGARMRTIDVELTHRLLRVARPPWSSSSPRSRRSECDPTAFVRTFRTPDGSATLEVRAVDDRRFVASATGPGRDHALEHVDGPARRGDDLSGFVPEHDPTVARAHLRRPGLRIIRIRERRGRPRRDDPRAAGDGA